MQACRGQRFLQDPQARVAGDCVDGLTVARDDHGGQFRGVRSQLVDQLHAVAVGKVEIGHYQRKSPGLVNRLQRRSVPLDYQHVMVWGGLHASIPIALVLGLSGEAGLAPDLRTTLLADPSLPGAADAPVTHTLVLEVDVPTRSVAVDYRDLDTVVVPERGVRVRTDDDDAVAVAEARVAADDRFHVTLAEPRTEGALFVEYAVSRNPSGGNHAVDVVVDGVRETEARLVVMG